ncbi:hypothetical protein SeMB42_g05378 [Synchytrium endobioticum]|uniref:intramembrane prenyl-peptidase Rce1 n=1 Tax=Synchytrium endobioticum TaxID=286115 RepID=A0A507CRS0_9FUNG|nr:hypothetical protein SeMB42_g05378 [Synchytrium endobioticum]TPX46938.1 hypothetical protein SeLEV6574_g02952 [Synchytrium endobioticum]
MALFLSSLSVFKTKATYYVSRDDPRVIRQRMVGVASACVLSSLILYMLFAYKGRKQSWPQIAYIMGLRTDRLPISTLYPLFLTATLFLGPLVRNGVDGLLPFQSNGSWRRRAALHDLRTWRNYIVGPVVEEWVFRACMIPVMYAGGWSKASIVFITPLLFGASHLHHAMEFYRMQGRTREAATRALQGALLQFSYTTLFGWYSSFLFLRTGHLAGPTVSHVFCNIMGLPDFRDNIRPSKYRNVYRMAYTMGILGFAYGLVPLTNPSYYGGKYWK